MSRDIDRDRLNAKIDRSEAFNKILKYCAYQERSEHDVLEKLKKYGLEADEVHRIIRRLKDEQFIDDRRYARIFALSKLRSNKWGRIRIRIELKRKKIDGHHIEAAFRSIEDDEYSEIMRDLLRKKKDSLQQEDLYIVRNKVARYLFSKGFENDLVWALIDEEIS